MVAHAFNPRQRQADFWVQGQPGLQSEFQDSQGYAEKPCLRKKKKKKEKKERKKKRERERKEKASKRFLRKEFSKGDVGKQI